MTYHTPYQLRQGIRTSEFTQNTSGLMPGYVQCNLVIVPAAYANDFKLFCELNAQACPLISYSSAPGKRLVPDMGEDIDIATDIPSYQVYRYGNTGIGVNNIADVWQDDFIYFLLGCSFSFEEALEKQGVEVRNITEGKNVPMYITNVDCKPVNQFRGKLVVSMRPMTLEDAEIAVTTCKRFPQVHGAPVAIGSPESLGINNLQQPDFGDAVTIKPNEVPVFWACGVTPQLALINAKLPVSIAHSPGCMLVSDRLNSELETPCDSL